MAVHVGLERPPPSGNMIIFARKKSMSGSWSCRARASSDSSDGGRLLRLDAFVADAISMSSIDLQNSANSGRKRTGNRKTGNILKYGEPTVD